MGSANSKQCSCLRRRRRSTAYEEETSSSRSIEIDIRQQNERPLRTSARKTKTKCFSHMIPKKILCCLQKDDMSMTKIERSEYNFHFPNEPLGIIINHVYERASEKY
ncbi:hypothetical protein MTP99_011679 [Tenebrio molitor]|nr:hypothetical protein MTP99_011679 [Tenebrio molitor]